MSEKNNQTLDRFFASPKQGNVTTPLKRVRSSPELSPPDRKRKQNTFAEMATVGSISLKELMAQISKVFDEKQVATKSDIQLLMTDVAEIKKENKKLREEVGKLQKITEEQELRLDALENNSKKKNLIIRGLPNMEGENYVKNIEELCTAVMKVENIKVERARKIEVRNKEPIYAATFSTEEQVVDILRSTRKLRGTKIAIDRDLAMGTRRTRGKLLQVRREILKINANVKVAVRNNMMICDNTRLFWRRSTGLRTSDGGSGSKYLKDLLGEGISTALEILDEGREHKEEMAIPGGPSEKNVVSRLK